MVAPLVTEGINGPKMARPLANQWVLRPALSRYSQTSPLNNLVRELARLAATCSYSITARLMGGKDGDRIELKATRESDGELEEYVRHVSLSLLEREGAPAVAKRFVRDARSALSGHAAARRPPSRGAHRKAHS